MMRQTGGRVGAGFLLLAAALVSGVLVPQPAVAQSGAMQRILYGEVLSAEPVVIQDRPSGRGAATGSTVGAIAGAAIAERGDGLLGALIGGAIGGAIGNAAVRAGSSTRGTELIRDPGSWRAAVRPG